MKTEHTLLEFQNVSKTFRKMSPGGKRERFSAVNSVSFSIREGEILGLLGESGCGKSTIAKLILGLEKTDEGRILWKEQEIQNLSPKEYRPLRREIQMIFQNPFGCMDPQMKIRHLLMEPLKLWKIGDSKNERMNMIREMLAECGLSEESLEKKTHEFSGGQLQRIAIARALLLRPKFLVADEIVSALDIPVQNQILELLLRMKETYGLTVLFITHDLAVAQRLSDRIMVMGEGKILEEGSVSGIFEQASHPYVRALKEAVYYVDL